MTLNWATSTEDFNTIVRIVDRAIALAKPLRVKLNRHSLLMDLTACHTNGCPLDLAGLADARDGDFGHDVFGIHRYIDRDTGTLTMCFRPRYAR